MAIAAPSASFKSAVGFFLSSEILAEQSAKTCLIKHLKRTKLSTNFRPFFI
jgi:hypothetical protein